MSGSYKSIYSCNVCNKETIVYTYINEKDEILCFCNKIMDRTSFLRIIKKQTSSQD
jgi:hypothetical protein